MTRGELGNILSAKMATRTIHAWYIQGEMEITDDWQVVFLETDNNGILKIYCEAPVRREDMKQS